MRLQCPRSLSVRAQIRNVDALSGFFALGHVALDDNDLDFPALVSLRDVHILRLSLRSNPLLLSPPGGPEAAEGEAAEVARRQALVHLLPRVWVLDDQVRAPAAVLRRV